jgi:hypothetical protein
MSSGVVASGPAHTGWGHWLWESNVTFPLERESTVTFIPSKESNVTLSFNLGWRLGDPS